MNFIKILIMASLILCLSLTSISCGGSDSSNDGVITIDTPTPEVIDTDLTSDNSDERIKTDEEITTEFTTCLRGYGFDVSDPTLNADGTVDLEGLRVSIMSDPNFDINSEKTGQALQECLGLLEDATFATAPTQEDQIELQDNLLEFAECIRENGIDIPDPEFSNDPRVVMRSMFENITITPKVEKVMESCSGIIFGQERQAPRTGSRD
ncbi:MAG: hypothetical protein DK302_001754 [Chloroflexi bacterium]|jgi:hypothetical protein|nr:MAG: hypothetical protein DK302_001754 [Chloroflexota bacterium]